MVSAMRGRCLLTIGLMAAPLAAPAADCAVLSKITTPPATTIVSAKLESSGSFQPPTGAPLDKLPEFCRVAGVLKPSDDSHIEFEVWMPATGWNGKFQGIGNGGFAGSISYAGLADAIRNGYAAASTDTGHKGGGTDAGWALGHPEKIVDFGHRAIHEMTVKGKAIVESFYGSSPRRSYFSSCSNGGRQALMEAQRYPEDYDGIIAGAPANYWSHLLLNAVSLMQATAGTPASYIPSSKLPAIQAAALAACDASDGVKDGVIENPARCRFDPAALLCGSTGGTESSQCLTAGQVKALRQAYDGLRSSKGALLFPGYSPGGEADNGGWGPWITGQAPEKSLMFAFGTGYFRNMVYSNAAWDYKSFNLADDARNAEKPGLILNSTNPDLKRFEARRGKLILYHGWCDAAIPAQNAIDYYESVVKKMGRGTAERFVRLYMVPGMQHCGGGAGPNVFGQAGVARSDARQNISAALERWVEAGLAPAEIIAARYKTPGVVERTRPLCPFPQVARYKGSGDTNDAANFECGAQAAGAASPPAGRVAN